MVVVVVLRGRVTGKSEISNVNFNIPTVYKIAVRHKLKWRRDSTLRPALD